MKKFRGWNNVFGFTYRQSAAGKGYRIVTAIVALVVFLAAGILSVLSLKPSEEGGREGEALCAVEKIYVLDLADMGDIPYETWLAQMEDGAYYEGLRFETVSGVSEEELQGIAARDDSDAAVGVVITSEDGGVLVRALVPSTGDLSLSDGQEASELVASMVELARMRRSGLTEFQLSQAAKPIVFSVAEAGEGTNILAYMIRYLAPAVFGLVLYFMLLLYGQTISKEVSTEKTSKLMETLLTSLHPYALLTGKVFAIVAAALMQFALWLAAGAAGIAAGLFLGHRLYPQAQGDLETMVAFLRDNIGESALSPASAVLAFVIFALGFLFYCVLSGMAGSMVGRPEDASNVQNVFTLPIVVSWLVCYFGTLMENEPLLAVARNIPFTIPFCLPVDLLTGAVGLGQGLLSAGIVLVFSMLFIMLSARIYKGLLLYNGQKPTMAMIWKILVNKT